MRTLKGLGLYGLKSFSYASVAKKILHIYLFFSFSRTGKDLPRSLQL